MKNKKLLSMLTGLAIMPSIIVPLTTSCSKEESSNAVTLVGEAEQTLNKSTVATYKFKLENALSDEEQLSCEATNVVSSRGVMVEVADHIDIEAGKTDFSLEVTITTEGELSNNDSVNFDLVFKGQKKSKQTFTSEVKGLKITYIDDAKIIPLDKLVIKDGVLYGLNCTWDDQAIAECDTIFIPNNVVEICQDQYNVAMTKLTNLPTDGQGPDLKTIKFEAGSKPLFLNDNVFNQLANVEKVVFSKRLSYLGKNCFHYTQHLKTIDISSWDAEKFTNDNPFGEQDIFASLPETEGEIILCDDSVNADAYYTFTAVNQKFKNWDGIVPPTKSGKEDNFTYDEYGDKKIITDYEGDDKETIENLVIPSWCHAIKPMAFVDAFGQTSLPKLTSISVSGKDSNLEKIYAGAFAKTTATNVNLENAVNLKHLDNGVFHDSSIETIKLPNYLETISANCFNQCNKLTGLDLSNTQVKKISLGTFAHCGQLKDVKLGSNITWIGAYAFELCINLTTQFDFLKELSKVTYIGAAAFGGCESATFDLPIDDKSVLSYIGQQAFEDALGKNENIYIPSSVEYICDGAFSYNPSIKHIEVSKNNKNYQALNGYLYNSSNELLFVAGDAGEIPTNVETIRPFAAAGTMLNYNSLDLSKTAIKTIGASAFEGTWCKEEGGYSIALPQSVTSIGEGAFASEPKRPTSNNEENPGLNSINLGDLNQLTNLGERCFYGCKLLKEITIPSSLTEIKSQCFYNSGVERVKIPATITKIRSQAFYLCKMLEYIDLHTYETVPGKWAEPNAFGSIDAKLDKITVYIKETEMDTDWKTQFTAGLADLDKIEFVASEPK